MSVNVRLDRELYEVIKKVAQKNSRSAAKQIEYWCKLGIELDGRGERSIVQATPNFTQNKGNIK